MPKKNASPALLAFHGDNMVAEALRRGYISVDTDSGAVFSHRTGKTLGCKNNAGYVVFTMHLDGVRRQIKAHRAVWISAHGAIPVGFVPDHINRTKSDNRIANLRLVDAAGNAANRRAYSGSGNPSVKIDQQTADAIRDDYRTDTAAGKRRVVSHRLLSQKYGVSPSLIRAILTQSLWTN